MATASDAAATASGSTPASNELVDVYITHIESAEKIFVVKTEDQKQLESIWRRIGDIVEESGADAGRLDARNINPLTHCIAVYKDRWYRARVIMVWEDAVYVEYIDYGNLERVRITEIRSMPDDPILRSTGRLSQPCRLSGNFHMMDNDQLRLVLEYCHYRLWMTIDGKDEETSQYEVAMYFFDDDNKLRKVNDVITIDRPRSGLASENEHADHAPWLSPRVQRPEAVASSAEELAATGCSDRYESTIQGTYYCATGDLERLKVGSESPEAGRSEGCGNYTNGSDRYEQTGNCYGRVEGAVGTKTPVGGFQRYTSDLDAVLHGDVYEDDEEEDEDDETVGDDRLYDASSKREPNTWPPPVEDEHTTRLRFMWAHALALHYPEKLPPPSQSSVSEQLAVVTHVVSPSLFFVQTSHEKGKLRNLEVAMADSLSVDAEPIPGCLIKPRLCCVLYNEKKNVWERGRVMAVYRNDQLSPVALVQLIDSGRENQYPLNALKPIPEQFVRGYPAAVYRVGLGGHTAFETTSWQPQHIDTFGIMVKDKTLVVKFLTSTATPEVELRDMHHRCIRCNSRLAKGKICSVNELMLQIANLDSRW